MMCVLIGLVFWTDGGDRGSELGAGAYRDAGYIWQTTPNALLLASHRTG